MANFQPLLALATAMLAALLSSVLTWAIRPLMLRHALAKPNARSSHRIPTPQGAGIAVISATLIVAGGTIAVTGTPSLIVVFAATLFLAAVGFADDLRSIPVLPRLLLQAMAVAAVVLMAPGESRLFYAVPLWIERGLVMLAGLWFVNLVNFMDGLDLMTAAETVPVSAAIVMLGWLGDVPASTTIVAAALCGAVLGFAPFNRPLARIFLGDVGSLPIGLLLGWSLLQLAWHQQFAAAVLLPMYYLADATVTLARRIFKREPFWTAHRSHFYQRATDNGFTVWRVVAEVFILNILLATLAIATTLIQNFVTLLMLVAAGLIAVLLTLHRFSHHAPRRPL